MDDGPALPPEVSVRIERAFWGEIDTALRAELSESTASVEEFLQHRGAAWHLVGRVHFNLAEHRKDAEAPFASADRILAYHQRLRTHTT